MITFFFVFSFCYSQNITGNYRALEELQDSLVMRCVNYLRQNDYKFDRLNWWIVVRLDCNGRIIYASIFDKEKKYEQNLYLLIEQYIKSCDHTFPIFLEDFQYTKSIYFNINTYVQYSIPVKSENINEAKEIKNTD